MLLEESLRKQILSGTDTCNNKAGKKLESNGSCFFWPAGQVFLWTSYLTRNLKETKEQILQLSLQVETSMMASNRVGSKLGYGLGIARISV